MARPYSEAMQEIARQYEAAGGETPYTTKQVAVWAIRQGLWQPPETFVVSKCAEDLSRALREQYMTDPQGRRVRTKHAAKITKDGKQGSFWDDIRTASHEYLQIAFQQRRQGIVVDCHRLKTDVDSYNDNRNPIESMQLSLDFARDVEEINMAEVAV